jgi:hypothetical protein
MPKISEKRDIKSLIEHHAGIQVVKEANVQGVREWHSNCPWCPGSTDSFITDENGRYSHKLRSKGCGRHGDALDFLQEYVGMSYQEAAEELGLEDVQFSAENVMRRHANNNDQSPTKKWQESALLILERAERYLWHPKSSDGKIALQYLHDRGLTNETIKHFRVGYVPKTSDDRWFTDSFENWGLDPEKLTAIQREKGCVRIPDGIIIPWFVGGQVWKLAMKRPGQTPDYGQVLGSTDALFNVDTLQYGEPAMMVEGEIDCMSVWQEAKDLLNVVATGSSAKGRGTRWISELQYPSFILQSFDEDPAGDEAARWWMDTIVGDPDSHIETPRFNTEKECRIERWSPIYFKDPNEMLQKQSDPGTICTVRQWVEYGLQACPIPLQGKVADNADAEEELVYEPF